MASLKVSAFKALSEFSELKPQDYINYLSSLAALNKRIGVFTVPCHDFLKGRSCVKTKPGASCREIVIGNGIRQSCNL